MSYLNRNVSFAFISILIVVAMAFVLASVYYHYSMNKINGKNDILSGDLNHTKANLSLTMLNLKRCNSLAENLTSELYSTLEQQSAYQEQFNDIYNETEHAVTNLNTTLTASQQQLKNALDVLDKKKNEVASLKESITVIRGQLDNSNKTITRFRSGVDDLVKAMKSLENEIDDCMDQNSTSCINDINSQFNDANAEADSLGDI